MKVYPLIRVTYGDFDIRQNTVIAVFQDEKVCNQEVDARMNRLTAEEIRLEHKYEVGKAIPYLQ